MSLKDILKKSVYDQYMSTASEISVELLLITLAVVAVLALVVIYVYKLTYKGALYSSGFSVSLVLTGLVTGLIILPISSNLTLSLGMVGALSIVRYRTAVKDPRDIAFMFWTIAIGLTCGAGFFLLAIAGTFFIIAIIVILHLVQSRIISGEPCIAVIKLKADCSVADVKKKFRKIEIKSMVITQEYIELTAELPNLPSDAQLKALKESSMVVGMSFVKYNGDYAI